MRPKLSILFFFIFLFSIGTVEGQADISCFKWEERWENHSRSLSDFSMRGQIVDNFLILSNDRPDRDIIITIVDYLGTVVLEKYVPQSQSAYVMLPIGDLPDGNTYTIVLTSPNSSDRIYATFEK